MTQVSHAQEATGTGTTEPIDFVVGNAEFVLLHELAHLIINEKHIPILGPEEFAADYIAAMVLIRPPVGTPTEEGTLLKFAMNTVDGFGIAWQRSSRLDIPIAYWDTHALSMQRFVTIACLLYGSDPERFTTLPEVVQMSADRIESCPAEFEKAAFSIDWLFERFARGEDDPPGAPMDVRFESPPTRISEILIEAIKAQGILETTVQRFQEVFALEEPVSLIVRSCRQPEAAWIPATRELVFCYELLDAYYVLSRDQHLDAIESVLNN